MVIKKAVFTRKVTDEIFGKLIGKSIAEIEDSCKKEPLNVQIQQIILQTKLSASR